MGFLPFVPKASPTVFGFLWASLQDYPPTHLLPGHYFYSECACCTTLHSRTKLFVWFLSPPPPLLLCLTQMDKNWRLSPYLPLWHASSGPGPSLASFLVKCHPNKAFSPKKSLDKNPKIDLFPPTTKPHSLNPLTEDPPLLYWLGSSRWCSSLYVSSTILYVCLLLLLRHFYHSCLVSFSMFMLIPHNVKSMGSWACITSFYSLRGLDIVLVKAPSHPTRWASIFVAPFLAMSIGLPCWPIGLITFSFGLLRPIYFTFTSCYAHEPVVCHSCHAGSLDLLPLFLGFHNPFALLLPLVVAMSLLAVIPAMLAHWVYYLFSWASTTHLLYFYLLLCPWVC